MKIFGIYLRLNLIQKPTWLDNFRQKYDESVELHVTLIQPRYIEEFRIEDLKLRVGKFLNDNKLNEDNKTIEFNNIVFERELDSSYTFMLLAEKANAILELQKGLREILKDFSDYVNKDTVEYEENFRPHITVGRDIKDDNLQEAKKYFESDFVVKGILTDLVLPIVKDTSIEERSKLDNLTVLDL